MITHRPIDRPIRVANRRKKRAAEHKNEIWINLYFFRDSILLSLAIFKWSLCKWSWIIGTLPFLGISSYFRLNFIRIDRIGFQFAQVFPSAEWRACVTRMTRVLCMNELIRDCLHRLASEDWSQRRCFAALIGNRSISRFSFSHCCRHGRKYWNPFLLIYETYLHIRLCFLFRF